MRNTRLQYPHTTAGKGALTEHLENMGLLPYKVQIDVYER